VLAAHDTRAGVLTDVQWGSYLIYVSGARLRPLLGDRFELTDDAELDAFMGALQGQRGWAAYLDAQHIDWVLVGPDAPLGQLLEASGRWHAARITPAAALWQRGTRPGP
jgi:hypothetical protein